MSWRYTKHGAGYERPSSADGIYIDGPLTTEDLKGMKPKDEQRLDDLKAQIAQAKQDAKKARENWLAAKKTADKAQRAADKADSKRYRLEDKLQDIKWRLGRRKARVKFTPDQIM